MFLPPLKGGLGLKTNINEAKNYKVDNMKKNSKIQKAKKINSRAKGAAAERELANYLKDWGIAARRGQQFSGSPDSPDIVADIPGWHIECKRVENFSLYPAMAQAQRDMPKGHKPVVIHRRNGQAWVAIVELEHWLGLVCGPKKEKGGSIEVPDGQKTSGKALSCPETPLNPVRVAKCSKTDSVSQQEIKAFERKGIVHFSKSIKGYFSL